MQYLINLLGTWRFNWIDLVFIFLFSDLVQRGQWVMGFLALFVGVVLSVAAHRHVEN